MIIRMRTAFNTVFLIGVIALILTSCTQEKPKQIKQEKKQSNLKIDTNQAFITFAFLNENKDSLVSLPVEDEKIKPELATHAIIENKVIPIIFSNTKLESQTSNGRQTSHNFANNGGSFFTFKEPVKQGDFALLVNQDFIDHNKVMPFIEKDKKTEEPTISILSKKYNRKIAKSATIAELEDQSQIILTLFEVKNDSALAVLSYLHHDQLITLDFPAKYDEMSTWRVDDGGIFDFENLQVLSVFQSDKSIKIATVFWGAEGYNLNLYESTDGVFKSIAEAYGYSAPL